METDIERTRRFQFTLRALPWMVAGAAVLFGSIIWIAKQTPKPAEQPEPFVVPDSIPQIPFVAAKWKEEHLYRPKPPEPPLRLQMVGDFLRRNNFQGWTRPQIIELLGEHEVGMSNRSETYILVQKAVGFSEFGCLQFRFDEKDAVVSFALVVVSLTI